MSQVKQIEVKVLSQPTRVSKRVVKHKQEKVVISKQIRVVKDKVIKKHANKKSYLEMVKNALVELPQSTRGISRKAILKFIIAKYNLADHNQKSVRYYVNLSLISASNKGEIARVKGKGASDSFKLVGKKKTISKHSLVTGSSKENKSNKMKASSKKTLTKRKSVEGDPTNRTSAKSTIKKNGTKSQKSATSKTVNKV